MKKIEWDLLTDSQQENIATENEKRSTLIYPIDGGLNPIPEDTRCIVYCHSDNTHGWTLIEQSGDLGLDELIAQSWILFEDVI